MVDQVPPGARSVVRTTQERFIEPPPSAPPDDDSDDQRLLGLGADDGADDHGPADDFEDVETQEPVSRVQAFISSLKDNAGDGAIRIYAIRKPDPVGIEFRNPCNQEYTAGDVPFDESDLSVEALEVAIQKLYGGGRYQIKVRQNGNYAGAITRNIRDLPEQHRKDSQAAQNQPPPPVAAPPAEPQRTAREELREVLSLAQEIATIRGSANPAPQSASLPLADPMDTVRTTFGLFKEFRGEMRGAFEESAPSGSERHWSEGVLTGAARLFDSLKIGDLIVEGGKVVISALAQAKREAAANGNHADAAASTPAPPPERLAPPPPPATAASASLVEPAAAPLVSAEEMAILETVVAELRGYESDSGPENLEARVARAATAVRTLPSEAVAQISALPNLFLMTYLVQVNPEFADVADMRDAGDFLGALKDALANRNDDEAEEGSGELLEFPAAAPPAAAKEPSN